MEVGEGPSAGDANPGAAYSCCRCRITDSAHASIERVEEQRRRLLTEFSHELRTPLTSIRGTLQAVSDGILSAEERKEFADLSLAETERLGRLIGQIQELPAFEEHRVTFDFQTVNMAELAEQTVMQMKHKAEEAGMRLSAEGDRELYAKADPARLRQVLVNLVGNAIDHNGPGTEIAVRLRRHGNRALLTVAGSAFAEESAPSGSSAAATAGTSQPSTWKSETAALQAQLQSLRAAQQKELIAQIKALHASNKSELKVLTKQESAASMEIRFLPLFVENQHATMGKKSLREETSD